MASTDIKRTAALVLSLSNADLDRSEPVRISGVVTRLTERGLVVQDRSAGIWVVWQNPGDSLSLGDTIAVEGTAARGQYSPVIQARSVRKLGRGQLPKPVHVNFRQLSSGNWDAQYVSIVGIVRSATLQPRAAPSQRLWLKIALSDGFVTVSFPDKDAAGGEKLIGALVRIDGPAGSTKNNSGQITAPTLMVQDIRSVRVLRPAPTNLFSLPAVPIGRLMQYRSETDYYHRVRISGTVTYYNTDNSLIIEDEGRALSVAAARLPPLALGDWVEAVGFPATSSSGPVLEDAVVRAIAHGSQLSPTKTTISALSEGSLNRNLVTTIGRLVKDVREPSREVFLLQDNSSLLQAELTSPGHPGGVQGIREGSTVCVSGIVVLDVAGIWNTGGPSAETIGYKMLLRSPGDIQVIDPPSWWTTLHVIYVASVLAILALVFLALLVNGSLRRWRLQAVLAERERLAHEMHDTLAQSFAGIGFQLQAIGKAVPQEMSDLKQQLDLARALVRHSHKEAKRSIEPLNSGHPEVKDLLISIEQSGRTLVEGGFIEISTANVGVPRPVPQSIAEPLVRIGQEAVANAVRHADPSRVEISACYDDQCIRLVVADNGCGFVQSGNLLGFGLRSMRKRAAALSAKLDIVSHPGKGTRVEVSVPLSSDNKCYTFFAHKWRVLSERFLYVDR